MNNYEEEPSYVYETYFLLSVTNEDKTLDWSQEFKASEKDIMDQFCRDVKDRDDLFIMTSEVVIYDEPAEEAGEKYTERTELYSNF